VLLTTQYLDEADQLADRIAVMERGSVIAEGTSGELKASVGAGTLRLRVRDPERRPRARRVLAQALGVSVRPESDPATLSARIADAARLGHALAELSRAGVEVGELALGQPTLDEAFLALTGRATEDDATEEVAA
jgi:ABC-2 type transport system ATP-binding protein